MILNTTMSKITVLDYVGCFENNEIQFNITAYDSMTIQLCVETCKAMNARYAVIQQNNCGCEHSYDNYTRTNGNCTVPCSGQWNSICGGSGTVSVYDTCKCWTLNLNNWIYVF